jgi:tRNA(fMet)-specific endonuclease VapC
MSFQYLLDTNTLSEPARPVPNENILYRLNVHQAEIVTASIVVHELVYGCLRLLESKRRDSLWSYIQESVLSLPILDYDRKSGNIVNWSFFLQNATLCVCKLNFVMTLL